MFDKTLSSCAFGMQLALHYDKCEQGVKKIYTFIRKKSDMNFNNHL